MDKNKLNKLVEDYLNEKTDHLEVDFSLAENSHDQFVLHTVKRLSNTFSLYKSTKCGMSDLLIALRDYLLTLQVTLLLENLEIPMPNDYGIALNSQTGRYFGSFQLPNYVNRQFVETTFKAMPNSNNEIKNGYDLHTDPYIYSLTGFRFFKSDAQKLAVYGGINTPEGYTTLISLPTGGGKSLITQTLAYQKNGLTIVIVPTVSLAIDQVRAAKTTIKSDNVDNEVFFYHGGVDSQPILSAIRKKVARLLFISPEALINNSGFAKVVNVANASRYLKNIIIDEAHIVVDWGASFRVDYQFIEPWRRKLLHSNPNIRTLLLSATFESHCISVLKRLFSEDGKKWTEIRCDSLRHEPRYMLIKAKSLSDKQHKMVELVKKMPHPMIIYVARPDDASDIARLLRESGIKNVETFTGLTTGSRRKQLIDAWVDDQFEIMVATSAFGVGVDKSDVRTVIHMYIPQNANAYYQELGRGGRDRLPCLSIMCIKTTEDTDIAFGRISKKVMTAEKIVGRWNSMYDSPLSKRIGKLNYIDASVKPNYASIDDFDDSPTSDADKNWNIYVLLFLRRYNLIKIHEVIPESEKYVFVIEITDDILRSSGHEQTEFIERMRDTEWENYTTAFNTMKKAIKNSSTSCWSEMFYETYDKVSEYCAGCNTHDIAVESDFIDYPLKSPVEGPTKRLGQDQLELFKGAQNVITFPKLDEKSQLFDTLTKYRLSVYISTDDCETEAMLNSTSTLESVLIINPKDLRELLIKKCYYYVSGIIAVKYSGTPREIFSLQNMIISSLGKRSDTRIIHILDENVYFDWIDKVFTDIVDGPVVLTNSIIS